ncbi:hypothetical protein AAS21_gp157 [Pantoea phage vB_PagS_AAS21]|uniref:Uncharacterized protein n=1 Tax=Pantoea phage vB_PagS_AAS21 TaxID=2575261 RepID=A0A4Y5P1S4_9CAUD|nr:hypothetical protein AAS21_gp157 [Pantoea phage vB_PagS_AAS21]
MYYSPVFILLVIILILILF